MIETLCDYNRQGIIPGPEEDLELFLRRAEYCFKLKTLFTKELDPGLPFVNPETAKGSRLRETYDLDPTWVPLFYSNHALPFWQGGCAWIFQLRQETPFSAFIQLRQSFSKKNVHLGLYHKEELLDHELSHIGRMLFAEPKFEEFFAYFTSPSPWHRFLGPLFQSARETTFFLILLLTVMFADLALFVAAPVHFYSLFVLTKSLPFLFLIFAFFRLCWRWRQLRGCLKKLTQIAQNNLQKAQAILYRLTDDEIIFFHKSSQKEISDYIQKQNSLRWNVLHTCYPLNFSQ